MTPQSIHRLGGHRVQGRDRADAAGCCGTRKHSERAGVFALVAGRAGALARPSRALRVPTIGIGAG
ncbi:MAG: 3-methyl-2-oxobutanoate hydroxymethyltransferase [Elusimicrobia bacterium]|nr:3-methyl-2-oxobutanoate hydroxymethyltransferase [Elusimicrobiota bacterium]